MVSLSHSLPLSLNSLILTPTFTQLSQPAHPLHRQYWGDGGGSSLNIFIYSLLLSLTQLSHTHSYFPSLNYLILTTFILTPTFTPSTLSYSHSPPHFHLYPLTLFQSHTPILLLTWLTHSLSSSTVAYPQTQKHSINQTIKKNLPHPLPRSYIYKLIFIC